MKKPFDSTQPNPLNCGLIIVFLVTVFLSACGGDSHSDSVSGEEQQNQSQETVADAPPAKPISKPEEQGSTADVQTSAAAGTSDRVSQAARMVMGRELYHKHCEECHKADAKGIPGKIPPLYDSDFLMENKERSIAILLRGLHEDIVVNGVTYRGKMPRPKLNDDEIASILTAVRNWGNNGDRVTPDEVKAVRERRP